MGGEQVVQRPNIQRGAGSTIESRMNAIENAVKKAEKDGKMDAKTADDIRSGATQYNRDVNRVANENRNTPQAGMDAAAQVLQTYAQQDNTLFKSEALSGCAGCGGGRGCCGSFSKEDVQKYITYTNVNPMVKYGKSEEEAEKLAKRAMHSLEQPVIAQTVSTQNEGAKSEGKYLGERDAYAAALGLVGDARNGKTVITPPSVAKFVRIETDQKQKNQIEDSTILGLFNSGSSSKRGDNSQPRFEQGRESTTRNGMRFSQTVEQNPKKKIENKQILSQAYANMVKEKMSHLFVKENILQMQKVAAHMKEIKNEIVRALDAIKNGKQIAKKTLNKISESIKKLESVISKIKNEKIKAGAEIALKGLKAAFEKLKKEMERAKKEKQELKKQEKAQALEQKKAQKAEAKERKKSELAAKKEQERKKKEEQKIAKENEIARKKEAKREVARKTEKIKQIDKRAKLASKVAQKRNTLKRLRDISKKKNAGKKKKDKKTAKIILLNSKKKNKKKMKKVRIAA